MRPQPGARQRGVKRGRSRSGDVRFPIDEEQAMPLTGARIGVLMGGRSAEREVSLKTGQAVHRALLHRGYDAVPIDVDASLVERLREQEIELVFLALHGPGGEDGTIQGLLETLGIPYTGSGVRASAVAMHKPTAKALLACHGIAVPKGAVVRLDGLKAKFPRELPTGLRLPVIVKPAAQGSTIGVTIVRRHPEWLPALQRTESFDREAVVESYISGKEVTVSVLGEMALPTIEIVAPGGLYDYRAKYEKGRTRYLCPAPISAAMERRLRRLAVDACRVLGCEGVARVDFRISRRGRPYVLEVNTIPGMTETSLLPMAAANAGIDYETLTERILQSATARAERMKHDAGRIER